MTTRVTGVRMEVADRPDQAKYSLSFPDSKQPMIFLSPEQLNALRLVVRDLLDGKPEAAY